MCGILPTDQHRDGGWVPPLSQVAMGAKRWVVVEVISSTQLNIMRIYLLETIFDLPKISKNVFILSTDLSMVYDCLHGVQGPHAREIFMNLLGAPESCLINAIPKDDLNGGHADPILTLPYLLMLVISVASCILIDKDL